MSYQIIPIAEAVKAGIIDLDSRGVVWDDTEHTQGLRFLNDGRIVIIARSAIVATDHYATWSTTEQQAGEYSALLSKVGGTDSSTHLEFTPTTTITVSDFQAAMTDVTPAWSFYHWLQNTGLTNGPQIEFRFEHPSLRTLGIDHGWLEVSCVPLQAYTGTDAWVQAVLSITTPFGYGGHTPDGSAIFEWGAPLPVLDDLLTIINGVWDTAESGKTVNDYVLTRIRVELWEAAARLCYIDTIVIDGVAYPIEPGMAGAKLGLNTPGTTLAFVDVRDGYGRFETLAPVVGAEQSLMVGPLLPALFNDSDGYTRFLPSAYPAAPTTIFYSAIRVTNPT